MPIITKEIIEEQIDNVQNQIESVQLPDKTGIAILIIAIMALFFIPKVISFFLKLIIMILMESLDPGKHPS